MSHEMSHVKVASHVFTYEWNISTCEIFTFTHEALFFTRRLEPPDVTNEAWNMKPNEICLFACWFFFFFKSENRVMKKMIIFHNWTEIHIFSCELQMFLCNRLFIYMRLRISTCGNNKKTGSRNKKSNNKRIGWWHVDNTGQICFKLNE